MPSSGSRKVAFASLFAGLLLLSLGCGHRRGRALSPDAGCDPGGCASDASNFSDTGQGPIDIAIDQLLVGCTGAPLLGCPCAVADQFACNGAHQKVRLTCAAPTDGTPGLAWQLLDTCPSTAPGYNCDNRDATCQPILPGCVNQAVGFAYCDPSGSSDYTDVRQTCGPDLVSNDTTTTCAGVCSAGICQPPTCGDHKLQTGEECDDGNTMPLDGCEPGSCMKSKVLKLALGETHSCALCLGGRVRCWGDNTTGQLGLGHTLFQADRHPYQTLDASGHPGMVDLGGVAAIDVSAGYGFTCALLTGGNIRCWGANDTGQLGLGNTTPTPTRIAAAIDLGSGLTATAVSAGYGYACALLSDGTVRCWGDNSLGLLGVGNAQPVLAGTVALGTGVTAIAVAAGGAQACALLSGGAIHCWGDNYFGEFGLGTSTPMDSTTALPSSYGDAILKAGLIATSISLGSSSNCAILSDDELECWGANNVGQLGLGYTTPLGATETPSVPAIVPTGSPAVAQVATGAAHACALYSENAGIRCWGANQKGQLGYGDTKRRGETTDTIPANLAPIQLPSGLTAVAVYAGPGHTCALLSDASFRCWGWNDHGQLGLGVISGIEVGTPDSIGGASTETPDQLPPVQIFPPQEIQ